MVINKNKLSKPVIEIKEMHKWFGNFHVLKNISLDNLVLETDSPYLAPPPFRGKRNESSYLSIIIDKLTQVYEIPAEKIIEITTNNAIELFKIKL